MDGVFKKLDEHGVSPFPDDIRKALREAVRTRNFVVHYYFEQCSVLARDGNAWSYLIADLDWFSELFEVWVPSLDKWTDMLLRALGISEDELKSGREAFEEIAPDLRGEQLNALKAQLERISIDVPPLSAPAAQPALAADAQAACR